MPFKALVVGGRGGMGRWCASLLKRSGFDVSISSRRDASAVAAELGVGTASQDGAGDFDVVVLSVPLEVMEAVASGVGPLMRPGSLLADLSSLKKGPMAAMLKHAAPGVEVIGVHPLFGPGLESIEGRTVVLVPSGSSSRWLPIIRDVFEGSGARVTVATAEEHDRMMAIAQGLTHFMYIAWGRTIESMGIDLKDVDAYRTPVFTITKELVGRVLSQSPELYAQIQAGDEVAPVRRAFIAACAELAALADAGDMEAFARAFTSAGDHYGDTAGARMRSEQLIRRGMEDTASIKSACGNERAFALSDGRQVYGIIRETRRDDFILETPSETLALRYDAVTLLERDRLGELKRGSPRIGRDILVELPIGADAMVLRWALSKIDGVSGVEVETYDSLRHDHVVFRFTIDMSPELSEETLQRVLSTIWGLGLEVK